MFGGSLGGTAPHSSYAQTPSVPQSVDASVGIGGSLVDGTPMRVATIIILAVAGLAGLKWAGYRFNVTSG
jgi:hypothetical protein